MFFLQQEEIYIVSESRKIKYKKIPRVHFLQQEETYHEKKMGHNAFGRSLRHRLIKRLRFIRF